MSGILAGKVWLSDLHPDLKPLAATLADIGNDDGTSIYPSIAYVSWRLGRSERSVQDGMKQLRNMGVLIVCGSAKGGRGITTEYQLDESQLPRRESWQITRSRKGADIAPFTNTEKGADKPDKGCSLEQERVNPSSPDPLVETLEEPLVKPDHDFEPEREKGVSGADLRNLWKIMRGRYKQATGGKSLGAGLGGNAGERFVELVSSHGTDRVLAGFEVFLEHTGKEKLRDFKYNPIFVFMKKAEEWIDDAAITIEEPKPEQVAGPRGVSAKYAHL